MIREPNKKQPRLPGFESPFERNLDPNNRWVKLAEVIPWEEFATAYYSGMSADQGTPAKPARLMVETEANREELREAKRQRRRDHLERIPIEGKFGQGKNRHGLAKIRAKLADTSASWIRAIFLVMNLNLLVRFFFALNRPFLNAAFASLLARMVAWQALVQKMADWRRLPQGRPMIAAGAF
ncbi:MAG: transposase [Magnetococcales bacterium]|nr:transposase [Magnetococcales bacterium]